MNTTKIALVTGASRGLGRDMALRIAQRGLDLLLTYHTQKEAAEAVAAEIRETGRKAGVRQQFPLRHWRYTPAFQNGRVTRFQIFYQGRRDTALA